jgi:hypothetical protein
MDWGNLSSDALEVMKTLGDFGPTTDANDREVKGYFVDDEGGSYSAYWNSDYLRTIAAACVEVAEWLDKRATP